LGDGVVVAVRGEGEGALTAAGVVRLVDDLSAARERPAGHVPAPTGGGALLEPAVAEQVAIADPQVVEERSSGPGALHRPRHLDEGDVGSRRERRLEVRIR